MAGAVGFKPTLGGFGVRRTNQLSYTPEIFAYVQSVYYCIDNRDPSTRIAMLSLLSCAYALKWYPNSELN